MFHIIKETFYTKIEAKILLGNFVTATTRYMIDSMVLDDTAKSRRSYKWVLRPLDIFINLSKQKADRINIVHHQPTMQSLPIL